jgi:uncharacterized protein (AIM24 family)
MGHADTQAPPVLPLAAFLHETREREDATEALASESVRMARIDIDGAVWLKPGAAVAYRGRIGFERRHTLEADSLRDAALREAAPLVRASGQGRLFCGHHGAHVRVVRLEGESIVVSWHDLLAFEESLTFRSSLVGHGLGIAAGGMVTVTLSGHGAFAIVTHGRPLTLAVTPGDPISTDPHSTLAWSPELSPTLKMDVTWRSAFGHGGHEAVQMHFDGSGVVLVQPHDDPARFAFTMPSLSRVTSMVTG